MSTFIDTSALLAVLDADDQNHPMAKQAWENLVTNESDLVCTNYVLVETFALVQSRLGLEAVRTLQEDIVPLLRIEWIDAQSHASGVAALLIAARRQLSLKVFYLSALSASVVQSLGQTSPCKYFWHSSVVSQNVTPPPPAPEPLTY